MDSVTLSVLIGIVAVLIINLSVTSKLLGAVEYTTMQKLVQGCIVWLFPVVGVVIVGGVLLIDPAPKRQDPGYTEPQDGIPPAVGPSDGLPH